MSTATDMLSQYLAAEAAVLQGKFYTIGGQQFSREDLDQIRAGRREWERRVAAEQAAAKKAPAVGGLGFAVARLDR